MFIKSATRYLDTLGDLIKKENDIYSSVNDITEYRLITLQNGLQLFLIDDKESTYSTALTYVDVGSNDNPDTLLGLAHFLEHMLFMGSDLYPGESYFQNMVSKHGGETNAFTTDTCTQYYFSANDNFLLLLKIFSRFFVSPLFDTKMIEKEVYAVDSEHKKNIGSDAWRTMHLGKKFYANKRNRKFATGTYETLLKATNNNSDILREKLVDFYEKHYSSDKMVVFIAHKIDDEFIEYVKDIFGQIPKKDTTHNNMNIIMPVQINDTPNKIEIIKLKTLDSDHILYVNWLLKGSIKVLINNKPNENFSVHSFSIMNHILNNKGKHSIYDILKKEDLIQEIYFGVGDYNYDTCMYSASITMTDIGIKKWEDILYLIDAYVKNLYKIFTLNNDLFFSYYRERCNIDILNLQLGDKKYGPGLCMKFGDIYELKKIDLRFMPISFFLHSEQFECFNHFMSCIKEMNSNKAKIILCSNKINDTMFNKKDKYYHMKYKHFTRCVNVKRLAKAKDIIINNNDVLPPLNIYVDSTSSYIDHKLIKVDPIVSNDNKFRRILLNTNNLYYVKKTNTYNTYNIYCVIKVYLDSLNGKKEKHIRIKSYVYLTLYFEFIDKKNEWDKRQLAQTRTVYVMTPVLTGMNIIIRSYNNGTGIHDSFNIFMNQYFTRTNIDIDDLKLFKMIYDNFIRYVTDNKHSDPYTQIRGYFDCNINSDFLITDDEILIMMEELNINNYNIHDLNEFINQSIDIMSQGRLTGVFGGSISLKHIIKLTNILETYIDTTKDFSYTINHINNDKLCVNHTIKHHNPNNNEKAIGFGIFAGICPEVYNNDLYSTPNFLLWNKHYSLLKLLITYLDGKFMASIRTSQQVGYIAYCSLVNVNTNNNPYYYLLFTVQSTKDDLYTIVKKYIDIQLVDDINNMGKDEFEIMKKSLCKNYRDDFSDKYQNLYHDCERFNTVLKTTYDIEKLIDSKDDDYLNIRLNRLREILNNLECTTYEYFIQFANDIINKKIYSTIFIEPANSADSV